MEVTPELLERDPLAIERRIILLRMVVQDVEFEDCLNIGGNLNERTCTMLCK